MDIVFIEALEIDPVIGIYDWERTITQKVVLDIEMAFDNRPPAASDAITALVRELALQSQLMARRADHWLLRVERESLNQPQARERLRAALEAAGHASQISVELGVVIDSPARRNAAAAAERQRVAEDIVMNDPYVQSLVRDYGAKIVPGSIKPA